MRLTNDSDGFLECSSKEEISNDKKLKNLVKISLKKIKGYRSTNFIARRLSNPEIGENNLSWANIDSTSDKLKSKSHMIRSLSDTSLVDIVSGRLSNVLKEKTLLKKSTEIIETKIKLYINQLPNVGYKKRTKMKRLAATSNIITDGQYVDNDDGRDDTPTNIRPNDTPTIDRIYLEKLIPLMNKIDNNDYYNVELSSWAFLRNNYPNSCKKLEKSLKKFLILTNNCVNYNATDPTERFFIQQLNVLANDALINVGDSNFPTISMETLTNYVNDIQQIYTNQLRMNLKYAVLNDLLVALLKIFAYAIKLMECIEIPPQTYNKIINNLNIYGICGDKYSVKSLILKCFTKVVVTNRLIVAIKKKQKKHLDRCNNQTVSSLSSSPKPSFVTVTKSTAATVTTTTTITSSSEVIVPTIIPETDIDKVPVIHGIDNFTIIKLISQGACATVYLVCDNRTNEHYALKMIGKRSTIIKNRVKNVFVERDILSVTNSPFIVELYCSFETATHVCLLTEYVHGGDCAALLRKRKPFSTWLIRHITAQLVLAIEHIHNIGIVHRDIKPANVLLSQDGSIKLTDFGLSTVSLPQYPNKLNKEKSDASLEEENLVGTPDYFAPEIIQKLSYGKPVDWWCLGIFMYEASFTEPPFYGENIEELFHEILYGDILWPTDIFTIKDTTKNLIVHLLEKDVNDRWGDHNINIIKNHPFFKNHIDWDDINNKKFNIMRKLSEVSDTRYFDDRSEFYDHEADFMSDLSLNDFSKFSENDVFSNYQYSSPSFSHKIRLSTSINQFSDDSKDSISIKNIMDSSLDSDKTGSNIVRRSRFNPSHRSSLLGAHDEHIQPDNLSPRIFDVQSSFINSTSSSSPRRDSTSIRQFYYPFHRDKSQHAKLASPDKSNTMVVVTLTRNNWVGEWPGFVVGVVDSSIPNSIHYTKHFYIKEINNINDITSNIHVNMILTNINGLDVNSMSLNEINSILQCPNNDTLIVTLVPNTATHRELDNSFEDNVHSSKFPQIPSPTKFHVNKSNPTFEQDICSSFSSSTPDNESEIINNPISQHKNSNLESYINDPLYILDNTHQSPYHIPSMACQNYSFETPIPYKPTKLSYDNPITKNNPNNKIISYNVGGGSNIADTSVSTESNNHSDISQSCVEYQKNDKYLDRYDTMEKETDDFTK